ncbi:hypothetical protein IMSAGC012_02903 [Lachnospiraceae bacterium]|jgi:hypothetical protein|nr:hypothetical protein IMSAGC012_02903 [Lachnospiraceae bacterium]GFI49926.1 hypothetical protein IMSAGC020_01127 [Lachnospiraceae bacterium]
MEKAKKIILALGGLAVVRYEVQDGVIVRKGA